MHSLKKRWIRWILLVTLLIVLYDMIPKFLGVISKLDYAILVPALLLLLFLVTERPKGKISRIITLAILVLLLSRLLIYETGGRVKETWLTGSSYYLRTTNGSVFEMSACKHWYDARRFEEPVVSFTAVGIDLSLFGRQISTPVIIRCGGYMSDERMPILP